MSVERLIKVAELYEKLAQSRSAQAGDIEMALKEADLWVSTKEIAPLLNTAKVPETASVNISVSVDQNLNVKFIVQTDPKSNSANTLSKLLEKQYSSKMSKALKSAKLSAAPTPRSVKAPEKVVGGEKELVKPLKCARVFLSSNLTPAANLITIK